MSEMKELDALSDALRDAKTNWPAIHTHIMEFRKKHDVSIMRFLDLIELHNYDRFWQDMCSMRGSKMHPNYRVGSFGRQCLDAVNKFFESEEYSSFDNTNHVKSIEEIVCDINHEELHDLPHLGIFTEFCYDDETNCITIECPTNRGYEGKTDEEAIKTFIRERVSDTVSINFMKVRLLMFLSPIVAENPIGYGTMTIVNTSNKIIALTCSHVVGGYADVSARVHPYTSSLTPSFGRAHMNYSDIDVALVSVHPEQHYTVNSVHFNLKFYDLVFRDFDASKDHLRTFFMHMKVFKVGVETGLTEGTVEFVDKGRLMVKADSETGVFSRPGDSGSLVFIKHNGLNVVVGMVGRGTDDNVYTLVIGVWLFYKYLMETNHM